MKVRWATLVLLLIGARAAAAPNELASALRELGPRTLAGMSSPVTGGDAAWIAAVGPCDRPSPNDIAPITARLAAFYHVDPSAMTIRFGCKEPTGIVVEVQLAAARMVARVAADVAEVRASVKSPLLQWRRPALLDALALVDLDGDGVRDVVIVHDLGHGEHAKELWSTSSKADRGAFDAHLIAATFAELAVAAGQPSAGRPPPLVVKLVERKYSDEPTYRCFDAHQLAVCPAVEVARRFDRARAIAEAWAAADAQTVPDRDTLTEQALALMPYGVTAADRVRILPLAAPASPSQVIRREVARVLDRRIPRRDGEPVYPIVDPRPARALAMLGDAECAELALAEHVAAAVRLRGWLTANTPRPQRKRVSIVDVRAACVIAGHAYYVATWNDPDEHAGVFYDRGGTLRVVAMAPALDARLYRRGTSLIALIQAPTQFTVEVDGAPVTPPAAGASYEIDHQPVIDLVGADGKFFHWEGGDKWAPIAVPADVHPRTPPPKLDAKRDALGLWLWQQARLDSALDLVRHFDADAWQRDPDVRADVHQALMILGADPASLKRATAAALAAGK